MVALTRRWACFDELIRIAPADAQPYRLKGSLYTVARDYKQALVNYDKAVELGNDVFDSTYGDAEAFISRGHIRTKESDYGKAAEDFENALKLDSVYVTSHFRAGLRSRGGVDRQSPLCLQHHKNDQTERHYQRRYQSDRFLEVAMGPTQGTSQIRSWNGRLPSYGEIHRNGNRWSGADQRRIQQIYQ